VNDLNQDDLSKALGTNDDNQDSSQNQSSTDDNSQKIKVGDAEYTQEEINSMVGVAKQVSETEKRYNTRLDRVWPEYGRSQQRIKELETELESARKPKVEVPADEAQQIEEAKRAAKKLGILTKDDLTELGIVTRNDFDNYYRVQRETERILDEAGDLEKEIDGNDGRPPFKKEEILEYMQETGVRNMEVAYKLKYETQLDAWKDSKLGSAKKAGINTMQSQGSGSGNKKPADIKITKDNLNALVQEALEGKI